MDEEEKKEENTEKKEPSGLSRREFIKDAGLVIGGAAAGAVIAYTAAPAKEITKAVTPAVKEVAKEVPLPTTGVLPPSLEPEEQLLSREPSLKAVDVKNGKIIRMRPLHYDSKYPDLKPWTFSSRGKTWTSPMKSGPAPMTIALKKSTYHPSRVLYPLKRVDWEPGGDPTKINAQNRGKSKYKRISWDEATTIIANETKRIADKYGPEAVLSSGPFCGSVQDSRVVQSGRTLQSSLLHSYFWTKYGKTCSEILNCTDTTIGFATGAAFFWGQGMESSANLIKEISDNTEMLVGWACNYHGMSFAWPIGLQAAHMNNWFKEVGIKFVSVNTDLNRGAGVYSDKWIPVLPGTDPALQLAIAYTWMKEGTYDKEYIKTHSIGFEKWQAYVMGDEDGVPKTPKWASPICGVPVWTIKALAREWASKVTSVQHGTGGGGVSRAPYSHESARLEVQLLGMQGWGKPGVHQVNQLVMPGPTRPPSVNNAKSYNVAMDALAAKTGRKMTLTDKDRQLIPKNLLARALLHAPMTWFGGNEGQVPMQDMFVKRQYPLTPNTPEVRMFWTVGATTLGSRIEGFETLRGYQSPKIEFIVGQNITIADSTVYFDLILPISTRDELDDINTGLDAFTSLYLEKKAIPALGESKSDVEAVNLVAKKLGFFDEFTQGKTTADLIKLGYDKSGWADQVSWDTLNKNGYFAMPPDKDWEKAPPAALGFYKDPVKNPVATPSGKLEYYSQQLADHFPDDKERTPIARYIRGGPASEGWSHDESLSSARAKKYPLLITSPSRDMARHSESLHIDNPWIREITKIKCWDGYVYEPLRINPVDAAARGIENHDIVRIYNERGAVLGAAVVCEKVRPGAVSMDKAGGTDFIIPNELNRGGSVNPLGPGNGAGQGLSKYTIGQTPYNYLIEVEKVTGAQMEEWRKKYPAAFERDYDPAYGPLATGWIVEGAV